MPLTAKGKKILHSMESQYGKKKAEQVFYASKNKGTISGVDKAYEKGHKAAVKKQAASQGSNKAKG